MAFLKSLRRDDSAAAVATPNGKHGAAAREAAALEALIVRAEAAAAKLRSVESVMETAAALDAMQERFAAVEERLAGIEQLGSRLAAAEERAEHVARVVEEAERVEGRLESVGGKIDRALALNDELSQFLGHENAVAALRADAEALRGQLADLGENVGRMRAQADDALSAHRHTTSRLESFDQEHQAAMGKLDEISRRAQAIEWSLEPLHQAVDAIPNVQHQLAVLKALADQVGQKAAGLEQQREAVDRAATQISQLTRLDRELDAWLRRQEEQIRRFGAIEAKIAEVQATQVKVMARHDELSGAQAHVDEGHRTARQALTDLREQMRKSSESFELENRGLHAVSERVADLRGAVKECEARFAVLDAASQGAAAVQSQVTATGEQATALSQELARLTDEARRIGSLRLEAEQLQALAADTAARMRRVEELKPQVDEVARQLGTLHGTREMLADGLEQMRLAYEEMSRLREGHGETQAWLANADVWTRKVQGQVKDLGAMEPAVERIRGEVEQVRGAMAEIESRRELVDGVQRRLIDLGAESAELKERSDGLRARMDGAEGRFAQLARLADEAQRASDAMAGVVASVADAERRISATDDSVRALEARTQQLDELEERIRILGVEIEQRQGALDKATEHLARASALRQEAAETAQRLEEVARSIGTLLGDAEERSGGLVRVAGQLESRATALKTIERQLTQFESLLGKWESAQAEAGRALEQTIARQSAVDALEAQVKHVFGLAEKAVDSVQTISGARRDVEETRALLDETLNQFKAAEEALNGFEARRRQLERAEQRLARAEALAIDVRSTVESLQAQRTVMDHVIERAGALAFQMKQAEALVEVLKRERTLACDLKVAVAQVQAEEEEPGA
ncbi:MAG TPA: hypothetical protein VFU46_02275 [Gemmatimonadales bacterium]|nr:hypothetical protein [Gemmatimonadales bacterium]